MATVCCFRLRLLLGWSYLSLILAVPVGSNNAMDDRPAQRSSSQSGMVHFNNPKLLNGADKSLNGGDGYAFDLRQETVDPRKMGGIRIDNEARRLAHRLSHLSNNEMGVKAMQGIYDQLHYKQQGRDPDYEVTQLAKKLQRKIEKYLKFLRTNKITVENLYRIHLRHAITQRSDCCSITDEQLSYDSQYSGRVSRQRSCDLVAPSAPRSAFNPGRNLTEVFQHNVHYSPSIKWQYFISTDGIHNEFPAHNFRGIPASDCRAIHDVRHRDVYVSTIQPQRKHIVIMVDHGNSLSANQMKTAKASALHILASLSQNDRVGILALSNKVSYAREDNCLSQKLAPLTYEARLYFTTFISKLAKQETSTNHSLGFKKAFDMILSSLAVDNTTGRQPVGNQTGVLHLKDKAMIIYISRGLLSSLTDAKDVLNTIAKANGRVAHKVVINTYAVIDDGKPIMYEKSFLQDIADQNFQKYDVAPRHRAPVKKGEMTPVNTSRDLSGIVGHFYKSLNRSTPNKHHVSLPHKDQAGKGVIVAVTWPCFYDGKLLGMVGLDMHMGEVVEGITYFQKDKSTYAFLIDYHGYTVMHPDLQRPVKMDSQPMHTDIIHYETHKGFERIRRHMLRQRQGAEVVKLMAHKKESAKSGDRTGDRKNVVTIKYHWRRVEDTPYIVVIKTVQEEQQNMVLRVINVSGVPQMVYHRLDLLPTDNTCMHLKQLATIDTSALFLTASSFENPFEHLSQMETKRMVQGYLAYLKDSTKLITNPGLKDEVRSDVTAVSKITKDWMHSFRTGHMEDFIVRRYVATPSGVFQMFPGTLMNKAYDPTKRSWYLRAMEYPGKVTLTAPYLDAGGAGYIITISHTIYEGKGVAAHSEDDSVVAVMGMDVTLGYFYSLLLEVMPVCSKENITCFLMDDRGYLIAHRGLIEPNGKGPLENQHITHKEPLVANDILNHNGFVKKKLCDSFSDRTIQRFYHFNTSLQGVLTNLVHGEHCSKYLVTPVPGTNGFVGIVNQTCVMMRAFCPCSMVDRLCLNCHRMEQNECECPCECPLDVDFCTGKLLNNADRNPSCQQYPERVELEEVSREVSKALPQCYAPHCQQRKHKSDCFGVLDCEWCVLEPDGVTPLRSPFCASQRVCFAGVLGARTPYRDEIKASPSRGEEPHTFKSTPVGPVAGGIMGCFLVLALGVYCYRHHVHRNSHQYITTVPDNQVHMSHFEEHPEDMDPPEEPGAAGHTNIVLATFENPASISPYRVNTSYRRPAGGDSDHGYSTMTPHEDSEHASMTCIEPLLIGKDRYKPTPHTHATSFKGTPILPPPPQSNSRRSRSPTPPQTCISSHSTIPELTGMPPQTVIPPTIPESSHHILANVQVHRPMVDSH